VLFATADSELADLRIQTNIVPMIQDSGCSDLIMSSDRLSTKKQGKTSKKIEWAGGGWLFPIGAQNPNKSRSLPFPCALCDEVDCWPRETPQGASFALITARTKTYEEVRKILVGSTPLISGMSIVFEEYELGDQRKRFFKCLGCAEYQTIKWERRDDDGVVSGIVWSVDDDGKVIRESVKYLCRFCGHAHSEADKQIIFSDDHGCEWRPTAKPSQPDRRSYHVPALISLQQTWYACVMDWIEATGDDPGQPADLQKLQVFYNNILGVPFELIGQRPTFQHVSAHRRLDYSMGTVPARYAERVAGSRIALLTAAVDVHSDGIHVAVFGWTKGLRAFLVYYASWKGNPADIQDPDTWLKLGDMLENKVWTCDDGATMGLSFVVVDSQHLGDIVFSFCSEYQPGPIYPIKGRDIPIKGATMPFTKFATPQTGVGFHIVVDHYKDRWATSLRRHWSEGASTQPEGHFNAPVDLEDAALKELTVEYKVPKKTKGQQSRAGKHHIWVRPKGSKNELWDLLIYNSAALDIVCHDVCVNVLGQNAQNWPDFWDYVHSLNVKG
jgi:phage terminase large subunit GpA-like protein